MDFRLYPAEIYTNFAGGVDFNTVKKDRVQSEGIRKVTRHVDDHIMSLEMAKEISMIQRNERGKLARQHFIAIESKWNTPELVMARALRLADDTIAHLTDKVEILAPKAEVYDTLVSAYHLIGFREMCKELKMKETVVRAMLVSAGWLYKEGKHWIPYKSVIDKGYMEAKDFIGDTLTGVSYKYTVKGRDKVREMLCNE